MKEAMMQGSDKAVAEAFQLYFQTVNTGTKSAFSLPRYLYYIYNQTKNREHHFH